MADDTNGHTTGEAGTGERDATAHGVESHKPAASTIETSDVTQPSASRPSEWTASDSRGPLNEARPLDHEPMAERAFIADETPVAADPPISAAAPVAGADTPAPPRRSFLPLAAGVVIGAIIGAGSAYLVYDLRSGPGNGQDLKIAQLSSRVDALEQRPDPRAALKTLTASMAQLDDKVVALQKSAPVVGGSTPAVAAIAAAPKTSSASGAPPSSGGSGGTAPSAPTGAATALPSPSDTSALQQKIASLQTSLADLQKRADASNGLDGKVADLQSTVDGLKAQGAEVKTLRAGLAGATAAIAGVEKQATGARTGIEAIQSQQKSFEGRISAPALAVVADSLVHQIDQGQPYAQQVDALVTLGADPARVAILRENARKGVPSAKTLGAQFAPLAEPILATEHKVAANAGLLDRLKSGMSSMVSIRNTSDTSGNDLGSQVSRIETDLTHDDVVGAYATWVALPADAKAKSDAWGALAKTSAEAIDAARAVQQGAIASLGSRKS